MSILSGIISGGGGGGLARYANLAAFPATGNLTTLYLAEDTSLLYYWTGSVYTDTKTTNVAIDGAVTNFAALPPAGDHTGETYYVENYSVLTPTKLSGLYLSDGANWNRRSDKVVYSLLNFTAANKIVKTANAGREIIETNVEIDASDNLDLKGGGLKDTNVTTAVNLGSATDTSLNTVKQDILGGINEVLLESFKDNGTLTDLNNGLSFGQYRFQRINTVNLPADFPTSADFGILIVYIYDTSGVTNGTQIVMSADRDVGKNLNFIATRTFENTDFNDWDVIAFESGNVATATALETARLIGNVSFDGTADIVPETIASVNESIDTTCFPLFITNFGDQTLQPKNNSVFKYNSSANILELNSITLLDGLSVGHTGSIISDRISIGDGNFYLDRFDSNLPQLLFDTSDYWPYNRSGNYFQMVIGGSEKSRQDASEYLIKTDVRINGGSANLIIDNDDETYSGLKIRDAQGTTTQLAEIEFDCASNDLRTKINNNIVETITKEGVITHPLQPAGYMYNLSSNSNVTGDGTTYTCDFDTETRDQNSDMTSTTFTFPEDGMYLACVSLMIDDAVSSGITSIKALLEATGKSEGVFYRDSAGVVAMGELFSESWSKIIYGLEGDTVRFDLEASGGSKSIDMRGSTNGYSSFSICKVA